MPISAVVDLDARRMTSEFRRYAREMREIIPGQTKQAAQNTAVLASALAPSDAKNRSSNKLAKNYTVAQTTQGVFKIEFRRSVVSGRYGRFDVAFWTHEASNDREELNNFSYTPSQPLARRTPFSALPRGGVPGLAAIDTRNRGRKYLERAAARGSERYRILMSEALQHLFDSAGVDQTPLLRPRRVGSVGDLPGRVGAGPRTGTGIADRILDRDIRNTSPGLPGVFSFTVGGRSRV